jgi:hypothetical protein
MGGGESELEDRLVPRKWTGKDILLLLLYAPVGDEARRGIVGRTRLQKLVFVFEKEYYDRFRFAQVVPEESLPQFEPWRFGPFSKQVMSDIQFFKTIGVVDAAESESGPDLADVEEYSWWLEAGPSDDEPTEYEGEVFSLSRRGEEYVEAKLWPSLNDAQREALSALKARFVAAPLYVILQYVYSKFPDYAKRSEIAERFGVRNETAGEA